MCSSDLAPLIATSDIVTSGIVTSGIVTSAQRASNPKRVAAALSVIQTTKKTSRLSPVIRLTVCLFVGQSGEETQKRWHKQAMGSRPVAENRFDGFPHFGKGKLIFRYFEQRVITKTG